ncbi:MAG TPA: hypothetical protein VD903_20365 [Pseudonocardia sp.]|nr:hypothetical protein [Pseudonocardia sp.]
MSPTSTARHRSTARKVALCAAALVVTLLPTACGAAYADSEDGRSGQDSSEVVEVGGADAADPRSADEENGSEENGSEAAGQAEEQPDGEQADAAAGEDQTGGENDEGNADAGNAAAAARGEDEQAARGEGGDADGGLDVLGTDCTNSELQPHNGLQEAPRCVSTSFGEVAAEDQSPSLLITEAPDSVQADQDFTLTVSTRNLVRDRFLGAADGGYYKESSFLNDEGIQRGHFHTACRMLDDPGEAPDAEPEPAFFLATQDNEGGAGLDTVDVPVAGGLPEPGTAQCAVWAGDGSHRVPMMQRANQIPAFDVVRITVR